jgi:hypothetical protein
MPEVTEVVQTQIDESSALLLLGQSAYDTADGFVTRRTPGFISAPFVQRRKNQQKGR